MLAIATAAAVVRYPLSVARIARQHNEQILAVMTQENILLDIVESEERVAGSNPRTHSSPEPRARSAPRYSAPRSELKCHRRCQKCGVVAMGEADAYRYLQVLKEADGTTLLILTNLCVSKEARDAMVNYGAAAGAKMAWDRLAELLAEA